MPGKTSWSGIVTDLLWFRGGPLSCIFISVLSKSKGRQWSRKFKTPRALWLCEWLQLIFNRTKGNQLIMYFWLDWQLNTCEALTRFFVRCCPRSFKSPSLRSLMEFDSSNWLVLAFKLVADCSCDMLQCQTLRQSTYCSHLPCCHSSWSTFLPFSLSMKKNCEGPL